MEIEDALNGPLDALVRHVNVVKNRQGLHHFVPRADGVSKCILVAGAVRACDLFETGRVQRYKKRNRIILIGFRQIPGWNNKQLIRVGRDGRMDFRASYDNAVNLPLHDADVIIRMILFSGSAATVAFDIGLCDGHG